MVAAGLGMTLGSICTPDSPWSNLHKHAVVFKCANVIFVGNTLCK
jgi:hypothetical protein